MRHSDEVRGKKSMREFMHSIPNRVSHLVRQSGARMCGVRGLGDREWCAMQGAQGHGWGNGSSKGDQPHWQCGWEWKGTFEA